MNRIGRKDRRGWRRPGEYRAWEPFRVLAAAFLMAVAPTPVSSQSTVLAETTTAYHQIRVVDRDGFRILSFDGSMESRMSLADPAQGHFEYTDYFHMPWLWNSNISRVLMIGLGGGSAQRAYARHYPDVTVETVELDPVVRSLARQFFHYRESDRVITHIGDGRLFLRRTRSDYDVIVVDAYAHNRYGSYLPQHLVTREFFELAARRLGPEGVLCYNVMGTLQGEDSEAVLAIHRTMNTSFPNVYWFPALESRNVVLVATKSKRKLSFNDLLMRTGALAKAGRLRLPDFRDRVYRAKTHIPHAVTKAPLLTDDYAPLHRLLGQQGEWKGEAGSAGKD